MHSKRSQEGWFFSDTRHAPAVRPEDVPKGMSVVGAGFNGVFESALITCSHCHRTVILNPQRDRPRGYCSKCDHYICDSPACNAGCVPLKMLLDIGQERAFRDLQAGNPTQTIAQLRKDIL